MTPNIPLTWNVAPYFIVDDVVVTANFYRDKLGFHYEHFWGDPPCFCMVKRNGIIIMLSQVDSRGSVRPNHLAYPNGDAWDAYVWVDNADILCSDFKAQGVKIARGTSAISPTGTATSTSRIATAIGCVLGTTSRVSLDLYPQVAGAVVTTVIGVILERWLDDGPSGSMKPLMR